jgi:hypothetical protein
VGFRRSIAASVASTSSRARTSPARTNAAWSRALRCRTPASIQRRPYRTRGSPPTRQTRLTTVTARNHDGKRRHHDVAADACGHHGTPALPGRRGGRRLADGGPPADVPDDPNNLIQEAYAYFSGAIDEWLDDGDPDDHELKARHEALRVALTALLQVVSINLESGDNAQVIFETLNARGTPLLALDLVKNSVLYKARREGCDIEDLYTKHWQPELDQDYWRETVRQGRLNRPRAELFLMHWLTMQLGRVVMATELFNEFRRKGTGVTRKGAFFSVSATGSTAGAITRKLNALIAPRVHTAFLAARKAQRAAHHATVVKARKIAAAKAAAHARKAYCVAILRGEHNGLSINQVISDCGKPGRKQHIAVTGLTEDFLYYGGFLGGNVYGGRSYQLVFTNGYLSSVNYY